VSSVEYHLN